MAGENWGAEKEVMNVPDAIGGSWEDVIYQKFNTDDTIISFGDDDPFYEQTKGHRAIGVVYRPLFEFGNYVPTSLAHRYDMVIYIHEIQALHPISGIKPDDKIPETYPFKV